MLYSINMTLSHGEGRFQSASLHTAGNLLTKQRAGRHNFLSHPSREITSVCLPQQSVASSSVCDTASLALCLHVCARLSLRENDIQLAEPTDEGRLEFRLSADSEGPLHD